MTNTGTLAAVLEPPPDTTAGRPLFLLSMPFHIQAFNTWAASRGFEDLDHAFHCLLTEAFGDKALRPFRLIRSARQLDTLYGYAHEDGRQMQQRAQVVTDPLQAAVFDLDRPINFKSMEALDQLPAGARLGFEVRVRPTYRRPRRAGTNPAYTRQREHDAYYLHLRDRLPWATKPETPAEAKRLRHRAYHDWLQYQFARQGGAELDPETFHIVAFQRTLVVRQLGQTPSEGPDVICRGNLTISNPARFKALLNKGVGRHRAYGYGMLLLKQPHPVRRRPGSPPPEPDLDDDDDDL